MSVKQGAGWSFVLRKTTFLPPENIHMNIALYNWPRVIIRFEGFQTGGFPKIDRDSILRRKVANASGSFME
ncbi:MAG: hypothetical protein JJ871_05190 [Thalassospira sp.]|uniref:hypothetical protein n=1 Tax=Thalassospira sp. TaxID=1912094 RepID=UPI001B0FEFF3|nr:hypothetical protein [Thalassospira sp.]MBO6577765.1 hypothetical protein [Thalassospira sp.]MBO6802030.1 hypothetical protein [Thalassospira sp.]MBO6818577.1 hypothetical protein [Thalassospira sp.]MBO6887441.1 hypothetical protein [Thalassospira sp.]